MSSSRGFSSVCIEAGTVHLFRTSMSSSHCFSSVCIEAGTVHPFRTAMSSSHGFSTVCIDGGTVDPFEYPGVHPMVLVVFVLKQELYTPLEHP